MTAPSALFASAAAEESLRLLVESVEDYAIFMLDPQGRVMSWNAGARRIKGYEAAEILGRSFEVFYDADAVARGWPREELRRATAAGRFEDEGWRRRKDGSSFWASVVITALRRADGGLVGFGKVTRDLTERRAHEDALRRSEEQLRLMVGAVRDCAIFMLDADGNVLSWNAGAESMTGYAAAEAIGRNWAMFYTARDVADGQPHAALQAALQAARVATGREQAQGWRVRKDGTAFWASMTITPVHDAKGALRGCAVFVRDLTEERRLLELEQATRRTHEFLAVLAHELRNPLAPIRNAVGIMQLHPQMPAQLVAARDIIDRQLGQLTRLVDDLLDVARISTGKFELQFAEIDFRSVVGAGVEAIKGLTLERRQQVRARLPEQPVPMRADSQRLIQSLQNVLHNAVKYTPQGGLISVALEVDGRTSVTTVTDTGRGIAPDALERIFQMFVQEEGAAASEPGLGIGLNLARSLVEKHGGRLTAHSAGPGTGATFTMVLPLDGNAPPPELRRVSQEPPPGERLRVLVVDDNHDAADTMCRLLELLGHRTLAAYTIAEARAAAQRFAPEAVFLDLNLNLPDGDGYSLLREMQQELPPQTLFVAMTGYGQSDDRQKTARAGFAAHLVKPAGFAEVQEVLQLGARRDATKAG